MQQGVLGRAGGVDTFLLEFGRVFVELRGPVATETKPTLPQPLGMQRRGAGSAVRKWMTQSDESMKVEVGK